MRKHCHRDIVINAARLRQRAGWVIALLTVMQLWSTSAFPADGRSNMRKILEEALRQVPPDAARSPLIEAVCEDEQRHSAAYARPGANLCSVQARPADAFQPLAMEYEVDIFFDALHYQEPPQSLGL